jgi:hypothetical protein
MGYTHLHMREYRKALNYFLKSRHYLCLHQKKENKDTEFLEELDRMIAQTQNFAAGLV